MHNVVSKPKGTQELHRYENGLARASWALMQSLAPRFVALSNNTCHISTNILQVGACQCWDNSAHHACKEPPSASVIQAK